MRLALLKLFEIVLYKVDRLAIDAKFNFFIFVLNFIVFWLVTSSCMHQYFLR